MEENSSTWTVVRFYAVPYVGDVPLCKMTLFVHVNGRFRRSQQLQRLEEVVFATARKPWALCSLLEVCEHKAVKQQPSLHDPGGRVRLTVHPETESSAVFGGAAQEYRYRLKRTWQKGQPHVLFILMNPSTADVHVDDPTVAKCGRFARRWNYGGLYIGNTFAYRATDQTKLRSVADPIGPENDKHLLAMARAAAAVVFAYGQPRHRELRERGPALAHMLRTRAAVVPHTLRLSKDGTPWHPLYLPETVTPIPWEF